MIISFCGNAVGIRRFLRRTAEKPSKRIRCQIKGFRTWEGRSGSFDIRGRSLYDNLDKKRTCLPYTPLIGSVNEDRRPPQERIPQGHYA